MISSRTSSLQSPAPRRLHGGKQELAVLVVGLLELPLVHLEGELVTRLAAQKGDFGDFRERVQLAALPPL